MMQSEHVNAFREINEEKIANFQLALQNENWEEAYNQEIVNRKFNIFLKTFLLIFENSFPLVFKKKEDITNKWITKGIRLSYKHKRTLYTLVKKTSDDRLKLYYTRYWTTSILTRVMREAKKLYYNKLISKSENKIQSTWKIIKKETAKNQATDNITEIQVGKSKINNRNEFVNAFNKYFITIAKKLTTKNTDKN
jgi:hypothetical protein